MKIIKGDIWDYYDDNNDVGDNVLVITTNMSIKNDGCAVLGRGVARQALEKFPNLNEIYGAELTRQREIVERKYNLAIIDWYYGFRIYGDMRLIMFPVKYEWNYKADLDVIEKSLKLLRAFAKTDTYRKVYMPVPGIGFGELQLIDVMNLIRKYLGDLHNVYVVRRGDNVKDKYPDSFKDAVRSDRS